MSLSNRLAVIAADVLVLIMTWIKTAGTRKEARNANIRTPCMTLLIRDGEPQYQVLPDSVFTLSGLF